MLRKVYDLLCKNEAAAVAFRISQALSLLLCFRLITVHFGVVSYGIVGLVLSWVVYLTFLDFGIVSLMRTEIPFAFHSKGEAQANGVARLGLIRLLRSASILYAILLLIFVLSDWPITPIMNFLNLTGRLSKEDFRSFLILVACYAQVLLIANFCQAILSAWLKQYIVFQLQMLGSIVQVFAVMLGIAFNWSLPVVFGLMILSGFVPVLPLIGIEIARVFYNYDRDVALPKHTKSVSRSFFIVQLIGTVANNIDTLFVAHFYTYRAVAVYATMKLIVQMLLSLQANYMNQSWPQFSAMRARKDWIGISQILFDRLRKSTFFGIFCGVIIVLFAPLFFAIWSKNLMSIDRVLSIAFAFQLLICMISVCFTTMVYSFNFVHVMAMLAPLTPLVMYGVAWRLSALGPVAIVIANISAQFIGLGIGLYFYFAIFSRLKKVEVQAAT